jgi:SAM-dependent methyltransferase
MLKITSLHTAAMTLERLRGLHTSQVVQLATVGLAHPERVDYHPSGWLSLRALLRPSEVGPDDVFADIGAGKGRVLYQAARRYSLKRVIGVELSPELAAQARDNMERHGGRLRCHDVEFVIGDAVSWEVPDDVTIAYMFRPFTGATFRGVIDNLIASYDRSPRRLRILYVNPEEHDTLMATGRVRELPRRRSLIPHLQRYDRDWARVYEVTPRSSASS